jgi:hypothetical protein
MPLFGAFGLRLSRAADASEKKGMHWARTAHEDFMHGAAQKNSPAKKRTARGAKGALMCEGGGGAAARGKRASRVLRRCGRVPRDARKLHSGEKPRTGGPKAEGRTRKKGRTHSSASFGHFFSFFSFFFHFFRFFFFFFPALPPRFIFFLAPRGPF